MPAFTVSDPGIPPGLRGPVLVDVRGLPRYWPVIDSYLLHGELKRSTARVHLRAIERLYRFSELLWPRDSLDAIIGRADLSRIDDLLHAYFSHLRREGLETSHPSERAWRVACQFAVRSCDRLLSAGPRRRRAAARELLDRLSRLDHQLALCSRRRRPGQPRGLPAPVIEDLYELILPDSPRNPFRNESLRWRNFVLALLLLHQGLRRDESLVLAVDAVKSERDRRTGNERFWLNVSENPNERSDPRPNAPSLKNLGAHEK